MASDAGEFIDRLGLHTDRRQLQAAAILVMAIDLPAPMYLVGDRMKLAAEICPGISLEELGPLSGEAARLHALVKARDLINEMIEELA